VQEEGCWALCNLTVNADNNVKAGAAGAVEAAVAALRAHPDCAVVQELGCWVLINLTVNADNKVKAGAAGAVEAVVAALRAHPDCAAVQKQGCRALANVCFSDAALQRRAREAGAIEVLQAAQAAFPTGPVADEAKVALDRIIDA
jgi:hypothetical protein